MKKNWDDIWTEYGRHWKFVWRLAQEKKTIAELVEDYESGMKKQAYSEKYIIRHNILLDKIYKNKLRLYTKFGNFKNKIIRLKTKQNFKCFI